MCCKDPPSKNASTFFGLSIRKLNYFISEGLSSFDTLYDFNLDKFSSVTSKFSAYFSFIKLADFFEIKLLFDLIWVSCPPRVLNV